MPSPVDRFDAVEIDGRLLRALRRGRHLSQAQLVATQPEARVSRGYIAIIEGSPSYRVSRATASSLAGVLGVNLEDLVSQESTPIVIRSSIELATFVAGPPILHPRQFFGRAREIERLFRLWSNRPLQHVAIVGPRRSGKTSLLRYMQAIGNVPIAELRVEQQSALVRDIHWVYLDLQNPRLRKQELFLHHLLSQLELPIPEVCDLDHALESLQQGIRAPTIIQLDEFDAALHPSSELDDAFWEGLRSAANNLNIAGNLGFIIASTRAPADLGLAHGFGSPFFNMFGYSYVLGPLTDGEARELTNSSPIPFPEADTDWLLDQSRGWPFPLQILCSVLLEALESGDADHDWRQEALARLDRLTRHDGADERGRG